jgi:putative membrane protein
MSLTMRRVILAVGLAVLAMAWSGPLPNLAERSFAAHMTMHMAIVAIAAPLVALALSGTSVDPTRAVPALFAPIRASVIEFAVVWVWHAPAFHHAARHHGWALVLEQASFLAAGLLLWIAVCGGDRAQRPFRSGAGIVALVFTSMHMTLLGALFALANRPLFVHGPGGLWGMSPLQDQHLGGAIMLLIGGASYLGGGLWATAGFLRPPTVRQEASS